MTETNYKVSGTDLLISKAGVQEILGAKKYGDFSLLIETSGARSYRVELSIVTKILRDKADAQEMMRLATAGYNVVAENPVEGQPSFYNGADGYFVLANDIDMEGEIIRFTLRARQWRNSRIHGDIGRPRAKIEISVRINIRFRTGEQDISAITRQVFSEI